MGAGRMERTETRSIWLLEAPHGCRMLCMSSSQKGRWNYTNVSLLVMNDRLHAARHHALQQRATFAFERHNTNDSRIL